MAKLRSSLTREEVNAILRIPITISITDAADKESFGGYFQAFKAKVQVRPQRPSSSRCIPNYLRSCGLRQHLQFLRYAISCGELCVIGWLVRQFVSEEMCSVLCPICDKEDESFEHILFRCSGHRLFGSGVVYPSGSRSTQLLQQINGWKAFCVEN